MGFRYVILVVLGDLPFVLYYAVIIRQAFLSQTMNKRKDHIIQEHGGSGAREAKIRQDALSAISSACKWDCKMGPRFAGRPPAYIYNYLSSKCL